MQRRIARANGVLNRELAPRRAYAPRAHRFVAEIAWPSRASTRSLLWLFAAIVAFAYSLAFIAMHTEESHVQPSRESRRHSQVADGRR